MQRKSKRRQVNKGEKLPYEIVQTPSLILLGPASQKIQKLSGSNSGLSLSLNESDVLDRRTNTLEQYGWQCRLKIRSGPLVYTRPPLASLLVEWEWLTLGFTLGVFMASTGVG